MTGLKVTAILMTLNGVIVLNCWEPRFPVEWILLVREHIANQGIRKRWNMGTAFRGQKDFVRPTR